VDVGFLGEFSGGTILEDNDIADCKILRIELHGVLTFKFSLGF